MEIGEKGITLVDVCKLARKAMDIFSEDYPNVDAFDIIMKRYGFSLSNTNGHIRQNNMVKILKKYDNIPLTSIVKCLEEYISIKRPNDYFA